jgi:hypothetical protein
MPDPLDEAAQKLDELSRHQKNEDARKALEKAADALRKGSKK